MGMVAIPEPIASAAAVFFGRHGDVCRRARQRGVCRQRLYREAHAVVAALHRPRSPRPRRRPTARPTLAPAAAPWTVTLDPARQQQFAATAQALGVSLSATHALLTVVLEERTPSRPWLGRAARAAGKRASATLAVLDTYSADRARQVAADEIFAGKKPVLMTVEQDSLCWLGGRLAPSRDGVQWAAEFGRLPALEQVSCDRGQGLRLGLAQVNQQRQQAGVPEVVDQSDHFHPLHRAYQNLRQVQAQAKWDLQRAEQAQRAYDRAFRKNLRRNPAQGRAVQRAWRRAEQSFDRWSRQERATWRLRAALRLFTPEGELNTPARAQAEVQAALADLDGPGLARVRRGLGPEAFTFLERTQTQLEALPVAPELVRAAVRVEGLARQPALLQGEEASARLRRGLLLAAGLVLALAGPVGAQARALVQGVLQSVWRASSLVEGLNSVLRMHQSRQKRLTQELLDLKRLHWNVHQFQAGRRKGASPYGRLGVVLPTNDWWQLLNRPPEQLREELSALNTAA
jgi:hypothetical protein